MFDIFWTGQLVNCFAFRKLFLTFRCHLFTYLTRQYMLSSNMYSYYYSKEAKSLGTFVLPAS